MKSKSLRLLKRPGVIVVRMSSNPFFPYMLERIGEGIGARARSESANAAK